MIECIHCGDWHMPPAHCGECGVAVNVIEYGRDYSYCPPCEQDMEARYAEVQADWFDERFAEIVEGLGGR